ncbi:conserved hypothetical protein [Neospora caninum Liverpool]|uniref:Transmembrane protein n=1 Tax=Neospora caninum (strain Liverpool) TaxID=572307 RepID=F0VQC5_NEOCL|nr:conserved hypothetical protein [Neospora caninum Liverpool]CBZ55922.1 conserved hypothetical protein [Neospora caninum Liverpool]CEL70665.1 TPA: hypothetical protein BN1204_063480 [Neospora caninum Liverpool]|eukprot:XP_003885948.1 conserved hypothetical protein [Neospora caninum Liverpool]
MEGGPLAGFASGDEERSEEDETSAASLSRAPPTSPNVGGSSCTVHASGKASVPLYEGPDIFGTEAFDAVCCVDILDQSYKPEVRRILALWGLLLLASTSLLLVGFFGAFRFLHRDGTLDLTHNLWKQDLFWSAVVQFMVTSVGVACGFIALVSHTQLGTSCEVHAFQRFFTWCLLFHLAGALFCFVAAIKLTAVNVFAPSTTPLAHRAVSLPRDHRVSLRFQDTPPLFSEASGASPDGLSPRAEPVDPLPGKSHFRVAPASAEPSVAALSLSSPFALSPFSAKRALGSFQFSPPWQNPDRSAAAHSVAPTSSRGRQGPTDPQADGEALEPIVKSVSLRSMGTERFRVPRPNRLSVSSPSLSLARSSSSFSPSFAERLVARTELSSASINAHKLRAAPPPRESPIYRKMLFSSLTVNFFEAVLHALCFVATWRLARRLGRLFGLKMPRIPF